MKNHKHKHSVNADGKHDLWYALTNNKVTFDAKDISVIQTVLQIDGLGRAVRTAKTGFVNGVDGWNASGAIEYDSKGRTVKEGMTEFKEGALEALLKSKPEMTSLFTSYGYDRGGQVVSVTGENFGHEFNYVTDILYDQYGQRTRIDYGNGTFTEYKYDPARRWLDTIKTQNKWGQSYQNISYKFDLVGNVRFYENNCLDAVNGNYKTRQEYSYDSLYLLVKAEGYTTYNPYSSSVPEFKSEYTQEFEFDAEGLGNMMSKVSKESVTPQKAIGDNINYSFNYVYDKD